MHCIDLGESFQTHIYLQHLDSIQPRTSPSKYGSQISQITYSDHRPTSFLSKQSHFSHCGFAFAHLARKWPCFSARVPPLCFFLVVARGGGSNKGGSTNRAGPPDLEQIPPPPLRGRVLLRLPQRHLGGGQSGGAGFGSGFCPAPRKIHRNLQI